MSLRFETTPIAPMAIPDAERIAAAGDVRLDADLGVALVAHGAAVPQREALLNGALCITTGQQPGLFLGPLYTVYKALSAICLADIAAAQLGRPVVPVFWVAGDDHDYHEANHLYTVNLANEVIRFALPERPADAPLTPLYREAMGAAVSDLLTALEDVTPETEFRSEIMEWLARHYHAGADLATAFTGALAELMGRFGLVVFTPTHPAAKRAMRPWIRQALARAGELGQRLAARGAELEAAGAPVPVHVGDQATTVMLECRMGRDRLVADDGTFHARRSGEQYDLATLEALLDAEPERFSPNVLLRPVVEAAILPTIAYVAGPGELAYLPQCDPVYDALGVVPQARTPRWSARVIEAKVQKVLETYDIVVDDLHLPEGQLEQRLVREEMPEEAARAIAGLRAAVADAFPPLEHAAVALDPTLTKPVESARHHIEKTLGQVEKRFLGHLKQRNTILMQQLAKARANLYPLGKPQERILNPAPYLIRYGDAFLDQAAASARTWYDALEPRFATP